MRLRTSRTAFIWYRAAGWRAAPASVDGLRVTRDGCASVATSRASVAIGVGIIAALAVLRSAPEARAPSDRRRSGRRRPRPQPRSRHTTPPRRRRRRRTSRSAHRIPRTTRREAARAPRSSASSRTRGPDGRRQTRRRARHRGAQPRRRPRRHRGVPAARHRSAEVRRHRARRDRAARGLRAALPDDRRRRSRCRRSSCSIPTTTSSTTAGHPIAVPDRSRRPARARAARLPGARCCASPSAAAGPLTRAAPDGARRGIVATALLAAARRARRAGRRTLLAWVVLVPWLARRSTGRDARGRRSRSGVRWRSRSASPSSRGSRSRSPTTPAHPRASWRRSRSSRAALPAAARRLRARAARGDGARSSARADGDRGRVRVRRRPNGRSRSSSATRSASSLLPSAAAPAGGRPRRAGGADVRRSCSRTARRRTAIAGARDGATAAASRCARARRSRRSLAGALRALRAGVARRPADRAAAHASASCRRTSRTTIGSRRRSARTRPCAASSTRTSRSPTSSSRAARVDVLVWPETVYPTTFGTPKSADGAAFDRAIGGARRADGRPLVFGSYDAEDGREYNAAVFLEPAAAATTSTFDDLSEGVALPADRARAGVARRPAAPRAGSRGSGSWQPGAGPRSSTSSASAAGASGWRRSSATTPSTRRNAARAVRAGAELIVTLSNDSWLADGDGRAAPLRRLGVPEHRDATAAGARDDDRHLGRRSTPAGDVVASAGVHERAGLVASVAPVRDAAARGALGRLARPAAACSRSPSPSALLGSLVHRPAPVRARAIDDCGRARAHGARAARARAASRDRARARGHAHGAATRVRSGGVARSRAYDDGPLPIGHGQTISQPYIVALMCELAGAAARRARARGRHRLAATRRPSSPSSRARSTRSRS